MYLYSLIAAFLLVSIANYINNDTIQNFGSCALFILSAFCIAYLLYQFQQITTEQLLLNLIPSKEPPKWYHFHRHRNHNQIFLYLLLNYTKSIDQILIYFFKYQMANTDSESPCNNIFNKLKEGKSKLDLFPEIKQFFMKEVMKQYNPSESENLGEMEIERMIHEKGKLSLLIIQLMMIKDEDCIVKQNIRKCYCFLKQHEHLVMKIPNNYTFLAKIEIHGMLEILEEELTQTVKNESLTEKYHLKAYEYFEYQEKLQHFRKEIIHVCDLNTLFWTEVSNDDPDCSKIKKLIRKSHHHSCKVERMFSKLMDSYKRSSIVIYDTLFHFSHLVLNCELSSTFNPYFSINTKYQQELALWKKENTGNIDSQFTDTYDIPMCMISAEKTDRGSILWENSTFRQEYAFMTEMKELSETKTINIDQLILPFYRAQHESWLDDFSQQESLRFNHRKTIIYKHKENHNFIEMHDIEVQTFPSIKFGLKLLVFIKKNKSHENENESENGVQTKLLIVDEQLESSFLSENLVNEWELNNKNDEWIHSNIEKLFKKNTEWLNFLKDCEGNKSLKFDMEHSDYEAALIRTMTNDKRKRYFVFEVRDAFVDKTPYQKALKLHPQAAPCLETFMHNTMKNLQALRQKMLDSSVKQYMTPQTESKDYSIKIPLQMDKIMVEKEDQEILLQNIFHTMSQPTTPKKIITWRIVTVMLIILIMGTMVANIIITQQRQSVYKSDITTIQNYNLLIQYIGRSAVALREYNYWAFNNISSPSLPYYQKELQLYQSIISTLLYSVSGLMANVWTAYDFQVTGKLSMVNETEFGVVTNYILSSLTNLADQPYSSFAFPFLGSEFYWFFGMTQDQTSYMNNIYNSLYVALGNMLQTRKSLAQNVSWEITSIINQIYIFPTIIGCLLLVFFIGFSFVIEVKSNKIIYDTSKLFEIVTFKQKKIKIEQIKKFQEMLFSNNFEECKSNQTSLKDHSQSNATSLKQEVISQSEYITDLNSPAMTTDRQLKINKKNENNNKVNTKQNPLKYQNSQQNTTIKISIQKNNKLILLFYICVVTPFLSYFIGIFIGGMYLNNLIMSYIKFGSQMYYLCSFQQYIYLYTRETFLFEAPPYKGFSWGATLIPGMLQIYDSSRYIDANFGFLDQSSKFAQTKLALDKGNLCNYLYLFEQQSIYYNVTFEKSQCEKIGSNNHIMTKGFKSAFVYYVEQSVQLLSSNMYPQNLTRSQRVSFLQGPQLSDMKKMVAYFEQFYKVLAQLFEQDINNIIAYYIKLIEIISIVLIVLLFIIVLAVHHRWTVMRSESKQVQSILSLISFNHIKVDKSMRETFMAIDYHFYD